MFDVCGFQGSVTIPGSKIYLVVAISHLDYKFCWETKQLVSPLQGMAPKRGNLFSVWMKNACRRETSMIVKLISKKEEENIPFMKCKLPAVKNY